MAMDKTLCELIKKIQEDPLKKVEGLTLGRFYALSDHLRECEECSDIVEEIIDKYKDIPDDPNSSWGKTRLN